MFAVSLCATVAEAAQLAGAHPLSDAEHAASALVSRNSSLLTWSDGRMAPRDPLVVLLEQCSQERLQALMSDLGCTMADMAAAGLTRSVHKMWMRANRLTSLAPQLTSGRFNTDKFVHECSRTQLHSITGAWTVEDAKTVLQSVRADICKLRRLVGNTHAVSAQPALRRMIAATSNGLCLSDAVQVVGETLGVDYASETLAVFAERLRQTSSLVLPVDIAAVLDPECVQTHTSHFSASNASGRVYITTNVAIDILSPPLVTEEDESGRYLVVNKVRGQMFLGASEHEVVEAELSMRMASVARCLFVERFNAEVQSTWLYKDDTVLQQCIENIRSVVWQCALCYCTPSTRVPLYDSPYGQCIMSAISSWGDRDTAKEGLWLYDRRRRTSTRA